MKQVRLPSKKVVGRLMRIALIMGAFYFLMLPLAFGSYPHQIVRQTMKYKTHLS